ncbi:MAG: Twin-arginine translocation protein TatA, partial [uncultured Sphingomonas sp.]
GQLQPRSLDHPWDCHPAAVRRQPLFGDDGRRGQGAEELQDGHGGRRRGGQAAVGGAAAAEQPRAADRRGPQSARRGSGGAASASRQSAPL